MGTHSVALSLSLLTVPSPEEVIAFYRCSTYALCVLSRLRFNFLYMFYQKTKPFIYPFCSSELTGPYLHISRWFGLNCVFTLLSPVAHSLRPVSVASTKWHKHFNDIVSIFRIQKSSVSGPRVLGSRGIECISYKPNTNIRNCLYYAWNE